jgi:hypothetical protein
MNRNFLTIEEGKLVVIFNDETRRVIETIEQLNDVAEGGILCSSTIDFPEEATSDPNVIAMCKGMR